MTDDEFDKEWCLFRTVIHQWAVGEIDDCGFDEFLTHTEWKDPANKRLASVYLKQEAEGYWRASYFHIRMR